MGRFEGATVLITGAAGGLGRGAAKGFAAVGARLVLSDIDEKTLADLAGTLQAETAILAGNAMVDSFVHVAGAPETEALAELTRGVPMKRVAEVDEITTAILFAADPANSFMTGHALAIDGGIGAI
jgi:NAD(P)-dependent dehydrogenase (short-subunit alcohol dehydrogenase family)